MKKSLLNFLIVIVMVVMITCLGYTQEITLYDSVIPAIVSIETGSGQGTGFYVSAEGVLITNHHVTGNAKTVKVVDHLGTSYYADVIQSDSNRDIAILKSDVQNVPTLRLASPESYQAGDSLYLFGSPLGWTNSMTQGSIMNAQADYNKMEFIQVQGYVEPGNSGGPAVDAQGNVIGIVTMKDTRADQIALLVPVESIIGHLIDLQVPYSRSNFSWIYTGEDSETSIDSNDTNYMEPIVPILIIVITLLFALGMVLFRYKSQSRKKSSSNDFDINIH